MLAELGWEKTRVGAHMKGKENSKGAAIDVIGERLDERGKNFHFIAALTLWIASCFTLVGIVFAIYEVDNGGIGMISMGAATLVAAWVFMKHSDLYHKENAWVECKNLKAKATISMIDKSVREKKDYVASGDREYKFEYHYFVSSSGFVENALKYAIAKGMVCFEKKDGKFVQVSYFN